ncbi:hypothetical protein OF83DRAFT_1102360 [Amylostereum chailletii]|nr:hypothetical protein OF83DRAFT_1102360 [Amylostereum chailletii]
MASATPPTASSKGPPVWHTTKKMNMADLSRDDDFLSHLLVEKLGTQNVPLLVHKMDPTRRLPKTSPEDLMNIVRRLANSKGNSQTAIRAAVDDLLRLAAVRHYVKDFTQKELNAFATHASRYFELYVPTGSIEIAHTERYTHRTGKSELCILATRPLAPGAVILELKGSMADLTEAEDQDLKRTTGRHSFGGIRRDFSVIHSKQLKKNHLFLGPARFVNHDCDNNCELFREGRYITFRVMKPIAVGEEITAHYGDSYFGRGNKQCLCETCEKNGVGGYGPQTGEDVDDAPSDVESDTPSRESASVPADVNVNERRTRRGVYAVLPESSSDEDEDDAADANAIKLEAETEAGSALTSLSPSPPHQTQSAPLPQPVLANGLMTPSPDPEPLSSVLTTPTSLSSVLSAPSLSAPTCTTAATTPTSLRRSARKFEPVISTRAQKARAAQQLVTPPLSEDTESLASASVSAPIRTRSRSRLSTPGQPAVGGHSKGRGQTHETDRGRASSSVPPKGKGKGVQDKGKQKEVEKKEKGKGKEKVPEDPLCMTCGKILPIIEIDQQIVWGDFGVSSGRGRKKKEEHECPRCMRHFAIYQQPWPQRSGTSIPTPGSSTPAPSVSHTLTQKLLKAVDRKLKPIASSSSAPEAPKRGYKRKFPEQPAPPAKRLKLAPKERQALVASAGRSRCGRTQVPSAKVRESDPPKRGRGRPPKPRRGRPPKFPRIETGLASPDMAAVVAATVPSSPLPAESASAPPDLGGERPPKSRVVDDQPRDSHGRFGIKEETNGVYKRKFPGEAVGEQRTRSERAAERARLAEEREEERRRQTKRKSEVMEEESGSDEEEGSTRKHARADGEEQEEQEQESGSVGWKPLHAFPRLPFNLSPNPAAFARRRLNGTSAFSAAPSTAPWKGPQYITRARSSLRETAIPASSSRSSPLPHLAKRDVPEETSHVDDQTRDGYSEHEQGRAPSPEDDVRIAVNPDERGTQAVAVVDEPVNSISLKPMPTLWRPSPVDFARRRWKVSAAEDAERAKNAKLALERRRRLLSLGSKVAPAAIEQGQSESIGDVESVSSGSGEEDLAYPSSPDASKFKLQARAQFSPPFASIRPTPAPVWLQQPLETSVPAS